MRPSRRRSVAALVLLAAVAACGGGSRRVTQEVLVPPAVPLAPHAAIGLVTFTADNAQGALVRLATQRFQEQLLAAQPGTAVLELGTVTGPVDAAVARRLGAEHGVKSVLVGHLQVSDLKPRIRLLGGLSASTEVTLGLAAKLYSTETGATVWTRSASRRETMHQVSIVNGVAVFDAQDAAEAYGEIVNALVFDVTHDFRPTTVRQ